MREKRRRGSEAGRWAGYLWPTAGGLLMLELALMALTATRYSMALGAGTMGGSRGQLR